MRIFLDEDFWPGFIPGAVLHVIMILSRINFWRFDCGGSCDAITYYDIPVSLFYFFFRTGHHRFLAAPGFHTLGILRLFRAEDSTAHISELRGRLNSDCPPAAACMKTCLIGLGRIAWGLERDPLRAKPCTHAGALAHHLKKPGGRRSGFELVGVCDRHAEKIAAFLKWWSSNAASGRNQNTGAASRKNRRDAADAVKVDAGFFAAHENHRELLAAARPEFVIIATRTDSHLAIAADAMRAGARGILLEKPIGMNLREARKLERLARETGTRVWVNFERRYHPAYRLVKRFVDEERLGPLRSIQGQVLTWPLRAGANTASADIAGPLLHDAIHWLDLLIWYAGKPDRVNARMLESRAVPGVEDTAFLDLGYPEFQARLESGGRRNYFEFTIQLDFEHGRIRSGNEGHFWYRSKPSKRYQNFRDLQPFQPTIPRKNENPWLALYDDIRRETASDAPISFDRLSEAVAGMEIVQACSKKLRARSASKRGCRTTAG